VARTDFLTAHSFPKEADSGKISGLSAGEADFRIFAIEIFFIEK